MTPQDTRRLAVELSIQAHGGPWKGCDQCHEHEQETVSLDPEALALWLRHLNED